MVFYDEPGQLLFYGRDRLGRRSLLIREQSTDSFELCSVCGEDLGLQEVKIDGFYAVNLASSAKANALSPRPWPLIQIPWQSDQPGGLTTLRIVSSPKLLDHVR